MNKTREGNYDLLRIISAIAIITIHVTSTWTNAITDETIFGTYYLNGILTTCAYNVLSRFAVPCFLMLSGAFILADERNSDYKYFYRKTFIKIGIPTLVFSLLYFIFSILKATATTGIDNWNATNILVPLNNWVKGVPYYHMWYLYMMIGVYLLAPVILRFKSQINEKAFRKITWIFLIFASISEWTSTHGFFWDLGSSFCYISYFMAGYELRRVADKRKNNRKALLLILAGIVVEVIVIAIRYQQALHGIAEHEVRYNFIVPFSPLIVIASLFIFAGFSFLSIKKDFSKLSGITFLIYLFHGGIWTLLSMVVRKKGYAWDNNIVIPLAIIVVFILSALASQIYNVLWKHLENKWNISNRLCKFIKL